jgi:N-acetyl-alpha-D-muramate 1-phosphate uridylyltransferase
MIDTIFIFAAGLGTRMVELTENSPKPLLEISGKTLLEYNLELALGFPFKRIIINTHYFPEKIVDFVKKFQATHNNLPEIIIIHEPVLLETGGAIKNASKILDLDSPIFTLNSDVIIKTNQNVFEAMIEFRDDDKMDFLLLLQDYNNAIGYKGAGDFDLGQDNELIGKTIETTLQYIYSGLSIIKPNLIAKNDNMIFSLKEYYTDSNKAYGLAINDSRWYHASSPKDIEEIERHI